MNPKTIRHIWFDFSETIAFLKKEGHDRVRYEAYSEITGKPITDELIAEYEGLYQKFNHSNSALFRSLGQSSNFWSERINSTDPSTLYKLADENIPNVLKQIRVIVPISLFSNIQLSKILGILEIDSNWFTHILSSGMVKEPKPALDGFYKLIELSGIPAQQILYIGDDVGKDVKPAKQVGIQTGLMWKSSPEADYSFRNFEEVFKILEN